MQRLFRHRGRISFGGSLPGAYAPGLPRAAQKPRGGAALLHSTPALNPGRKAYLFFLPPAYFFFATEWALLSIVVSQEGRFLPLWLPHIRHSLLFSSWEWEEIFKNLR